MSVMPDPSAFLGATPLTYGRKGPAADANAWRASICR